MFWNSRGADSPDEGSAAHPPKPKDSADKGDTYNMHWSGQFNRSSWILNFGDKTTSTASPETRYRPTIAYWPEPTKMRTRPSSYDTREPTYKDETEDMYRSGKWTG